MQQRDERVAAHDELKGNHAGSPKFAKKQTWLAHMHEPRLIQPLYVGSRQVVAVRWRTVCVGTSAGHDLFSFGAVRLVPRNLLRERCDGRNKTG